MGFFTSNNIDVQRTDTGWTFTKTGKKGKTTRYQVTDQNGNGRYDKGDTAKLVKSELGIFSTQDMNNAMKGLYECEGNEYSYDEMYGLAAIKDRESSFSNTYSKPTNFSFSMGGYGPYWNFGMNNFTNPYGQFFNMGFNNFMGLGNYMQMQQYTPASINFPTANPYEQLQEYAMKETKEKENPNSEENIKRKIYEKIQDELHNVDEDGCNSDLTSGNHYRLKEIIDKVDENYQDLTDDMINESAEIINAGMVSTKFIDKLEEVYVDTAEGAQKEKSQTAINNLVNRINKTLDKYCDASETDKKKILSDYNYAELTAILIEFDQGDVQNMSEDTVKEFTQKVIKILNAGPKDIDKD